jgi:hypothetical protein
MSDGDGMDSVDTRIRQEPKVPGQICRNQIVQFDKSNGLVLSIPTAVRGAIGTRRGSFSSSQTMSGWKIGKNHGNPRG